MDQLTGCLIATPFHPQGTVLTDWALYNMQDTVFETQKPPGMRLGFYYRNHGEDCAEAYAAIVRYAWANQIPHILIVEDDIFIPDGALQALFAELGKAENADVAGIGGLYSWRDGPIGKPFPLLFPQEGHGPKLDYTPGDVIEVEAAGQGFFLLRTAALATQPEPWFALRWNTRDDAATMHEHCADMFFFRKLRSGTAPNGKRWRVLVHTGVTAEHVDRNTLEMSPPEWDRAYRERYGYPVESELIRRVVRLRQATKKGEPKGRYPSLLSEFGMSFGQPPRVTPPAFEGEQAADRPIARALAQAESTRHLRPHVPDAPPVEDFRVLNVGSGGCAIRDEVQPLLAQFAQGRRVVIADNEHPAGAEFLAQQLGRPLESFVIADAATLAGVPDQAYDLVYASHVLEHLRIEQAVGAVRHWWRVLRPGGRLLIMVPDVSTIGRFLTDGKLDVVLYQSGVGPITPRLILAGGQRYPGDTHQNCFDMRSLRDTCYAAGISERELWITPGNQPYECVAMAQKGVDLVGRNVRRQIEQYQAPEAPAAPATPRPLVAQAFEAAGGNGKAGH